MNTPTTYATDRLAMEAALNNITNQSGEIVCGMDLAVETVTSYLSRVAPRGDGLSDFDLLQLRQAAAGCTSGIENWPALRAAIQKVVAVHPEPAKPADAPKPFYPHTWERDGDRCAVCGDKDWMGGSCIAPNPEPAKPAEVARRPRTDVMSPQVESVIASPGYAGEKPDVVEQAARIAAQISEPAKPAEVGALSPPVPPGLHTNPDAMAWADYFMECAAAKPSIATSHGAMLAWFSNAMMAVHDSRVHPIASEPRAVEVTEAMVLQGMLAYEKECQRHSSDLAYRTEKGRSFNPEMFEQHHRNVVIGILAAALKAQGEGK